MNAKNLIKKFKDLGEQWADGEMTIEQWERNGKKFNLTPKQTEFLNSKDRYCLFSGGFGCGKTLTLITKALLMCVMFPDNRVLLGRKTISDIERALLPDFFELVPHKWYRYKVKEGTINFFNGSQIILFGLDSLQDGSMADIKKAQQKLKSLNLGGYFIDQLEEVEYDAWEVLNSRLRRTNVPFRQGNMTCNPANFWAYQYFKLKQNRVEGEWLAAAPDKTKGRKLIEGSMVDNKANLPADYLEDQLNHDEAYVNRYVYGIWSPDYLIDAVVFAKEHIKKQEIIKREVLFSEEGVDFFEEPKHGVEYQMGVDSSEGSVDYSSISIINTLTGDKAAAFHQKIPIPGLIQKVRYLYFRFNRCRIVPESNAAGMALLQGIRDLNVFIRKVMDDHEGAETEKLGWKTSHATKQMLISNFQNLLRKNFVRINDTATIDEMKTFIWSDAAKQQGAGAQRGFHDDNLMATMLSYWEITPKEKNDFIADEIERRYAQTRINKFKQFI